MPMKCIDQIAILRVILPATIHSIATRPLFSRIRCAWTSVVNEPIIAISTEKKTSGIFQEIGTVAIRSIHFFVYLPLSHAR